MRYSCRPGIVLSKICGQWLLIPTRTASEICPTVIRLTIPAVLVWAGTEKGKELQEIYCALSVLTHKDGEDVRELTTKILDTFVEKKVMIAEDIE